MAARDPVNGLNRMNFSCSDLSQEPSREDICDVLTPFDSRMVRAVYSAFQRSEVIDKNQPREGENCRWDVIRYGMHMNPEVAETVSLRAIGLCDGAILSQRAYGVRD